MKRMRDYLAEWGITLSRAPKAGPRQELRLVLGIDEDVPLVVGHLSHDFGKFVFEYTEAFRRSGLPPIPGFPDVSTERYESEDLWPFFQVRLPPSSREDVARAIQEKQLDVKDVFEMLATLGQRAAASPYVLQADAP